MVKQGDVFFRPGRATAERLYPLTSSPLCGYHCGFYTGHLPDGRQAFIARTGSERIAVALFDSAGLLIGVHHEALPCFTTPPADKYQDVNDAEFQRYLAAQMGFTPGLIRVKPFEIPREGIFIDDLPHLFQLVLEDPDRFGWDEQYRKEFLERIARWQADRSFVLHWHENEYTWFNIDAQGNLIVDD